MPLLPPNLQTDLALLSETRDAASHLAAAASKLNGQVSRLLSLDDAALTAWLQGKGASLNDLLTRHATTGAAINAALDAASATLTESGDVAPVLRVDVRPLADKLTEQGRSIDFATLTVTTPQPEP